GSWLQRGGVDAGQGGNGSGQALPRIDERLHRRRELEPFDTRCSDLADPRARRREACRLEVDDAERRVLERDAFRLAGLQRDAAAAPGEARVVGDHVVEQRPRHPLGQVRESEEGASRLLDRNRTVPLLDELDEPVCRIEPKLHGPILGEHMFVHKAKEKAASRGAAFPCVWLYRLTACLSWLPAENLGTRVAAISTRSPVRGFTP